MLQAGIFGRTAGESRKPYIVRLYNALHEKGASLFINESFYKLTKQLLPEGAQVHIYNSNEDIRNQLHFMITIGGDGTLLEAITILRDMPIPVLGINTGRLGFLSAYNMDEIEEAINAAAYGTFVIESRKLIALETKEQLFGTANFALNEITLHKKDSSSMIVLHVYMNDQYMNSYWADGLIISTPTGSTGYSLSCGGPIIIPESESFVITPIAPHNLNVRPLIINDSNELKIHAELRSKNYLISLDSRHASVPGDMELKIKKASFAIQLARKPERDFLSTLRDKLMWGIDKRN
jgi:NAD+ kinase